MQIAVAEIADECFNPRPPGEGRATTELSGTESVTVVSIRALPVKGGRLVDAKDTPIVSMFQSAPSR